MISDKLAGFRLFQFDEIASTNDAAKDYAEKGGREQAVFIADRQSGGRGRSGNQWESPAGNLYMSCILFRPILARDAGQYSFLTAVAIFDAVQPYLKKGQELKLKWPNDILMDGKKLSGILLESTITDGRLDWLVIGAGLNLAYAPQGAAKLGADIDRLGLAEKILSNINIYAQLVDNEGFKPVRDKWLRHAAALGEVINVRLPHENRQGVFETIDQDGCLILKRNNQRERIASGDVFFE